MANRIFVTGGSGFIGRNLIPVLVKEGHTVLALARSETAAATVTSLGAQAVRGDLHDEQALIVGMTGCDAAIHMAAEVADWGPYEAFYKGNIEGTTHMLNAARQAGIKRFVHVSSEAVLMGGQPIVNADESWPLPPHPMGFYALTKGLAERAVIAASNGQLETIIVRPRLVWGRGDTTVLARVMEAVKAGSWMWIGDGRHLTSTCHVNNTVAGIRLALEKGVPGSVYFLSDGEPVEFRSFITAMLQTQHIKLGNQAVPLWLARNVAVIAEWVWTTFRLAGTLLLTRTVVAQIGTTITINDAKARRELGYRPVITREAGLQAMAN